MWIVDKEVIAAAVRRMVPGIYAWLFVQLNGIEALESLLPFIPADPPLGLVMFISGTVASGVYLAIRWAASKWGWVGYLLVINHAPKYPELIPPPPVESMVGDADPGEVEAGDNPIV